MALFELGWRRKKRLVGLRQAAPQAKTNTDIEARTAIHFSRDPA